MRKEYDFSKGTRGKFYRPSAKLNLPVYLDAEVLSYLRKRARSRGVDLSKLVNELLRRDIALAESLK
jgi:hypothetical protein